MGRIYHTDGVYGRGGGTLVIVGSWVIGVERVIAGVYSHQPRRNETLNNPLSFPVQYNHGNGTGIPTQYFTVAIPAHRLFCS